MYLYGLLLHIYVVFSRDISLTDFFIVGNNGEISSSTIWHTHIAKGVVGQILSFFDKTQLQTMDAGGAYVDIVPGSIFMFGSILFSILILQAIFYFYSSFRLLIINKNKRQKIFLIIGYAIISFSLIKTSINGGIFNSSFFIGAFFIMLFILREKGESITKYYYLLSAIGAMLIAMSLYIDSLRYGNGLNIAYIATLLLLYNIILYGSEEKIHLKFMILYLVLFMSGWWVASVRDRDIYNYSIKILPAGQQIYTYDEKNKEIKVSNVEQTKSILSLSKELSKNITYMPIAAPGITCMVQAPDNKFLVVLSTLEPVSENIPTSSRYLRIKNNSSSLKGKNWNTTLTVFVNPCLPEPLSVIDGELKRNGLNYYILINPTFYDASNN